MMARERDTEILPNFLSNVHKTRLTHVTRRMVDDIFHKNKQTQKHTEILRGESKFEKCTLSVKLTFILDPPHPPTSKRQNLGQVFLLIVLFFPILKKSE